MMEKKVLDAYLAEIQRLGGKVTQSAAEAESQDA
jgi:hypothetical protein